VKEKLKVTKAIFRLKQETQVDKVLDSYDAGSFVEITIRQGGDVNIYRVYNSGAIAAR
jgi:ferredoxin-NADP reductase